MEQLSPAATAESTTTGESLSSHDAMESLRDATESRCSQINKENFKSCS